MRIIISDKYGLDSDQYAYRILRRNKRERRGKQVDEWTPIKWFTTIEGLIEGFAEHQIRTSNVETLAELLLFKKDLMAALGRSLPAEFEKVITPELKLVQVAR